MKLGLLVGFLLALGLAPARGENLIISLSSDVVEIRSNFTGARIALFGSVVADGQPRKTYDIVATTRGPSGETTVFEKKKFGPFWLNGERRKANVPSFVSVLSNRPVSEMAPPELRATARVGTAAPLADTMGADTEAASFRDALTRLRGAHDLFQEKSDGVRFLAPTLFQATIPIAGTAPIGRYDVDVKVFADGALLATSETTFRVEKAGAEQWLSQTAQTYGFIYGLALSFVALLAGWLASVVFRRE